MRIFNAPVPFREREREELKQMKLTPIKEASPLFHELWCNFPCFHVPFYFLRQRNATKSPWRWSSRVTSRDFLFSFAMVRVNRGGGSPEERNFLHARTNDTPFSFSLLYFAGSRMWSFCDVFSRLNHTITRVSR